MIKILSKFFIKNKNSTGIKKINMNDELRSITNTFELLEYILRYYEHYSIQQLNYIINCVIFFRKQKESSTQSLKVIVQLYFYILTHINSANRSYIRVSNEIKIFNLFVNTFQNNIEQNQIESVISRNQSVRDLRRYLNYHLDFRKFLWEYRDISRMFNQESFKVYGFSVYEKFDTLIYMISKITLNNNYISNLGEYTSDELSRIFEDIDYNNLFMEIPDEWSVSYLQSILYKMNGAIGIKKGNSYFLPVTEHILDNIVHKLLLSSDKKGKILELETHKLLTSYFGMNNVYHSLLLDTDKKEEQDFIVLVDGKVILIECKAIEFKEVLFDLKKAEIRARQLFKKAIISGAEQADRAEKYILNNSMATFIDKNQTRIIIDNRNIVTYKIVITLDDYYDLSELSVGYFKDTPELVDTWVVNIFDFQRILSHCGIQGIFDYIEYRTSGINTITSIQNSEIAQYGYYISKTYRVIPQRNMGIEINLMSNFENWAIPFDEQKNREILDNINFDKLYECERR